MARVEMEPGWEASVDAAVEKFFRERLGPDIRDDAKRYCPEDTGALKESIEDHISDEGTLIVSATGGAGDPPRTYAAWVELGHRVFHPSTRVVGPEVVPPEPFLRPALFQQRGE